MNTRKAQQLQEKYNDFMERAKMMRALGYHASADALLQRAWACADHREAVTLPQALASMHLTSGVHHA
jgi:hypothetical protein